MIAGIWEVSIVGTLSVIGIVYLIYKIWKAEQ